MARKKKRLRHGVGAKITVYLKYLHPRQLVTAKFPNAQQQDVLEGCIAVQKEMKKVSRRDQQCIIMRHDAFDDGTLIHAVLRYCKVTQEGAVEHLFDPQEQQAQQDPEMRRIWRRMRLRLLCPTFRMLLRKILPTFGRKDSLWMMIMTPPQKMSQVTEVKAQCKRKPFTSLGFHMEAWTLVERKA
jgi:hypothetical protein